MTNHLGSPRLAVIATVGFVVMLTGLCPATVHAQSATTSQATMAPSGHVPFVTQDTPVTPTAEQLRMREEVLSRSNPPGPATPVAPGFERRSPALPATDVSSKRPRSLAPSGPNSGSQPGETEGQQNAPGDMTYFLTHDQPAFAASAQGKIAINEPSVGTANQVVFVSSNLDAAYSTDAGSTFTYVNPYTLFPSIDGGFCCDQTVIYARSTGTMIWQLQYYASTQKNTYRIAFAPAASVASSGWCYYDFNPQMAPFNQPAGANFDYPDVALSDNFVYFQSRVFPASGNYLGTAIWRIPLAQASQCQSFNFSGIVFTDAFTFSLAQGATTTMYWFRHISDHQERLFNWPENSGTISWNDIGVTTWYDVARVCPGPDSLNWCNRVNGGTIGRTSWVAGGVIGSMWGSAQGGGRAYPYIRVARFNESTKALINEPDIWNGSFAFIYPSVNVNDRGHLGGVLFYGGGSLYPTLATLIWDDYSATPAPWELYEVVASSAGAANWGDYSTTRRHGTFGNTWVGTGQFKPSASAVDTYYLWFGRQRDRAPEFQVTPASNIAASGPAGGPFSPSGFDYSLSTLYGSVNYSITGIPSWLNASFTSGTATTSPVTDSFSLTNAKLLNPGTYNATISFTNTSNGSGDTTRSATLTVTAAVPEEACAVVPNTLSSPDIGDAQSSLTSDPCAKPRSP